MPFAWWELVLILLVLLLVFGAKRLPEMGRSLGKGMREFKDSVSGLDDDRETVHPPAELPPLRRSPPSPQSLTAFRPTRPSGNASPSERRCHAGAGGFRAASLMVKRQRSSSTWTSFVPD